MMQTEPAHVFSSPSFSSYSSSETFAQIAARVIHELRLDPHYNNNNNLDDNLFDPWPQNDNHHPHANDNNVDANHDDDFEFSFVSRTSPVSADDIFHNGQIRPTYPLFGRDVLNGAVSVPVPAADDKTATVRRRLPLRALMFEERETTTSSCSSSEDSSNELEGVAEGTYCVWTPRACKKSSSARSSSSSRRWKLRDLLLIRSHSDGKEPIMFVGPAKRTNNKVSLKHGGSDDGGAAVKGGEQSKRKLFLPYRQELVGLFGNGNIGVGRDSQSS